MKKIIEYWINTIQEDLGSFSDLDKIKKQIYQLNDAKLLKYFELEDVGVFAYLIVDDFTGGKALSELMFYIKPEYRGNIKLVKRFIAEAEKLALDNQCNCVKIGANIGYKDSSFIKMLRRWGYEDDTVSKTLRGE